MYNAVTRNIHVTVMPEYLPQRSDPESGQYFWIYTVEIANHGPVRVQLLRRHWIITDARGMTEEVRGSGVIGEQPVLDPGQSFRYTSGCPLKTPSGLMRGSYQMIIEGGETFEAEIPAFSLDSPESRGRAN